MNREWGSLKIGDDDSRNRVALHHDLRLVACLAACRSLTFRVEQGRFPRDLEISDRSARLDSESQVTEFLHLMVVSFLQQVEHRFASFRLLQEFTEIVTLEMPRDGFQTTEVIAGAIRR